MFEAKLGTASVMKKIVDSIKELLSEVQFDCNENAITLQVRLSSSSFLCSSGDGKEGGWRRWTPRTWRS